MRRGTYLKKESVSRRGNQQTKTDIFFTFRFGKVEKQKANSHKDEQAQSERRPHDEIIQDGFVIQRAYQQICNAVKQGV